MEGYGALVALVPEDLLRALGTQRSSDLARRWETALPAGGERPVEAALDTLVAAVVRATETGHSVFVVELL